MNPSSWQECNRIIVVGSSGSGKSWLSKRIAKSTGLPLIHLDNAYWLPGWTHPTREEWVSIQERQIRQERWIIDGNYNATLEMRFAAADLVIFLDIPRAVCLWSAVKRTGLKRSDLPDDLVEPRWCDREMLELCRDIWRFPKTGRKTILELHQKYPDRAFWRIKSRRDVKKIGTA